jgi:hypothetical protein
MCCIPASKRHRRRSSVLFTVLKSHVRDSFLATLSSQDFFSDVVSLLIPPCWKIRLQSGKVGNNGDKYRGICSSDGSNSLALLATTSREKGSSIQEYDERREGVLLKVHKCVACVSRAEKDLDMLRQVKKIIRHCIVKYKRKQTGDESATEEMRDRLREVVNIEYWKRAELLLNRGLKIEV